MRSQLIDNWEAQDEPEHFKTIRDRVLRNDRRTSRLLGLYQKVLQQGAIRTNSSLDQLYLRLTGLVVKQNGHLLPYNQLYATVFNQNWIDAVLANLRPYSEAISAWLASNRQDESRLLRGQALLEAKAWSADKSLSDWDYQFLVASQELEHQELQAAFTLQEEEHRLLAEAHKILAREQKRTKRRLQIGIFSLVVISLLWFAWRYAAPYLATYFNNRGFQEYLTGNLTVSQEAIALSSRLDPNNSVALYNQAWQCEEVRDFDCAMEKYRESAKLGLSAAYSSLARLEIVVKQNYAAAATLSWKGLGLEPEDPVKDGLRLDLEKPVEYSLRKNLGWARLGQARYEEAAEQLRAAIELNRDRASAHCLLAQVLDAQGKTKSATVEWETCLRAASPDHPDEDSWISLGRKRLERLKED